MSQDDFDALFDSFRRTAWRLETLPVYTVAEEAERIAAWRSGEPRPERSVLTSPWLRRIARTTAVAKVWERVRLVRFPLSEYVRYELVGYPEAEAAGERIRVTNVTGEPELERLVGVDFWLFDAGTETASAIRLQYDGEGRFLGFERADPTTLDSLTSHYVQARQASVTLEEFLAELHTTD